MSSKHYKWQTRWTVDREAGTATHDTGLVVTLNGGTPRATNDRQVIDALAVKNGHNAATMVQRYLREAAALALVDNPRDARL